MSEICRICGTLIVNDGKLYQVRMPNHSAESYFLDAYEWEHHDCHNEHWYNLTTGIIHLDKPLNDCIYFIRDGRTEYGWYERDGQRFETKLWAGINDGHVQACPYHRNFKEWLISHNWLDNWFTARKTEIYKDEVFLRRKSGEKYE